MIAFDTDVLTEILLGEPLFVARAATIPPHEQAVPVIVIEEIMRGRLKVIRQAEADQARISLSDAYNLFGIHILSHDAGREPDFFDAHC